MPELDGYELAAMIRQHPRYQQTAIIFVSAIMLTDLDRLRGYEMRRRGLRAGAGRAGDPARQGQCLRRPVPQDPRARAAERGARAPRGGAHRGLEASTAALQEADRRKDEFLAMLAHELRNPLAPIRTAVQLLRLKELAESQRARARDVIDGRSSTWSA